MPNALNTINNGIDLRTFGINTIICPLVYVGDGAIRRIANVHCGLDVSSETERTSTE